MNEPPRRQGGWKSGNKSGKEWIEAERRAERSGKKRKKEVPKREKKMGEAR